MRSPFAPLLLAGLTFSGVALLPVLARELEADSVRESLEAVLSQPLDPFRTPSAVDAESGTSTTDAALDDQPVAKPKTCLLYTSPSPRDATLSRMPSSA